MMVGFIYYLQNPLTNEIFYVGCTQVSLINRRRTHYAHLREVRLSKRKMNKRLEYLEKLLPHKANIVLLELVTEGNLDEREQHYIEIFRRLYPELTNMTKGGRGQDTYKYQTPENQKSIGDRISARHKGVAKPAGFAENMSKARMGKDNPAAGRGKIGWLVSFNHDLPIRMFKYGFEVNEFVGTPYAYGNVARSVQGKKPCANEPYGYKWRYYANCSKEVQDIVEAHYESLG